MFNEREDSSLSLLSLVMGTVTAGFHEGKSLQHKKDTNVWILMHCEDINVHSDCRASHCAYINVISSTGAFAVEAATKPKDRITTIAPWYNGQWWKPFTCYLTELWRAKSQYPVKHNVSK